jgi:hypothetical protein
MILFNYMIFSGMLGYTYRYGFISVGLTSGISFVTAKEINFAYKFRLLIYF